MCSSVWPALIYPFKCCLPRIGNGCPPVTNSDWEGVSLTLSFALGTKGVRILSDRGQETFRAAGSFFSTLNGVLIYFQNLSVPIHWGKLNAKMVLLGSPWLQRDFVCLVDVPGLVDVAKGQREASWHNSMLRALRG